MLHPLIHENRNGYNDITTTYNPYKYDHTLGEYVQLDSEEEKKKKSVEESDSESDSSDDSDSDSDSPDDKMARTQESDQNKAQTIEIKIVTSNQPNEAPTVSIT